MLKHPASFPNHHRMTQLLLELGASQSEIVKAQPAPGEVSEILKRRVAAATAAALSNQPSTLTGIRKANDPSSINNDLRSAKRFKVIVDLLIYKYLDG